MNGPIINSLQWRHNGLDGVSNHQPHHCLLNCLFRRRSKKTSKIRVTGLCAGNSPVTGAFPAQMASNAENVCIWWRHHEIPLMYHKAAWISITCMVTSGHWKLPLLLARYQGNHQSALLLSLLLHWTNYLINSRVASDFERSWRLYDDIVMTRCVQCDI